MNKHILYWVSVGGLFAGLLWAIAEAYRAPTNYVP